MFMAKGGNFRCIRKSQHFQKLSGYVERGGLEFLSKYPYRVVPHFQGQKRPTE